MSILLVLVKKVVGLLHSLLALGKRLLCFLRLKRRETDLLPFTQPQYSSLPSASDGVHDWTDWSEERLGERVSDKIHAYRQKMVRDQEEAARRQEEERDRDLDYFQQLAPDPKSIRTKKVTPSHLLRIIYSFQLFNSSYNTS